MKKLMVVSAVAVMLTLQGCSIALDFLIPLGF